MKKTLLIILASITLIALVIGIISFSISDSSDFSKVFFAKELGNYENIESYPIYDTLLEITKSVALTVDNIFYNIDYIKENMF